MATMEELRQRVAAIPVPQWYAAHANMVDAIKDIINWPGLAREILDDLEQAVSHWEAEAAREEAK